jgi:hypothetical protein
MHARALNPEKDRQHVGVQRLEDRAAHLGEDEGRDRKRAGDERRPAVYGAAALTAQGAERDQERNRRR